MESTKVDSFCPYLAPDAELPRRRYGIRLFNEYGHQRPAKSLRLFLRSDWLDGLPQRTASFCQPNFFNFAEKKPYMIVFPEKGRFGNQLFQYAALKHFYPAATLLVFGCKELRNYLKGVDLNDTNLTAKIAKKAIKSIGIPNIRKLAKKGIIGCIKEDLSYNESRVSSKKGIISNFYYFSPGFFQSEKIVSPEIVKKIEVHPRYRDKAKPIIDSIPTAKKNIYFVHVRRGDYVRWPSAFAPAVLPLDWYLHQINEIRQTNMAAWFLVVSDDLPYVEEFLAPLPNVVISRQDSGTDFCLMTQCLGGGVCSASSFAWWASWFVKDNNPQSKVIGPLYWAGHPASSWHPSAIQTSWIEYRPVLKS